jgi:hypothetical protein
VGPSCQPGQEERYDEQRRSTTESPGSADGVVSVAASAGQLTQAHSTGGERAQAQDHRDLVGDPLAGAEHCEMRACHAAGRDGQVGEERRQGDERHCRDQPHHYLEHDRDRGPADGRAPSLRCLFGFPHPTRQIAGVAEVVDRLHDRGLGGHATRPEGGGGVVNVVGEFLAHQASLPPG